MKSVENTEKEFDNFMALHGYSRVSHDVGESPNFLNADYVHKKRKIIVELKVLQKEHFPEGGIIHSLGATILKPESIDERGFGIYTCTLPALNRDGIHDNFEEPLSWTLAK